MIHSYQEAYLKALIILLLATSAAKAVPVSVAAEADSLNRFSDGLRYFNSAQYRKALDVFDKLSPADSTAPLEYYRSACLYQIGDYRRSLESLAAVDSSDSLYPLACFYRAVIMIALHNPAEAIRYLGITVLRDSTYNPARVELVNTLCAMDRFTEAEEFVMERFDEREAIALCNGLLDARKYEDAFPFIARLLTADSTNAAAKLMLAEVYYNTNKYPYAAKEYSGVLQTFGPSPFVIKRLALCHGKMKDKANLETAISLMNRYLSLSQDTTSEDIGNIGLWYYNLGIYDSAESFFRYEVKLDPRDPQAQLNLGLALMQLNQPREAIKTMQIAYSLSKWTLSFNLSILKSLAAAELRVKGYREAISTYRRVLEIDPEDAEAVYGLGLAYDQSHHAREAIYWYRRFLKSDSGVSKPFAEYATRRLREISPKK